MKYLLIIFCVVFSMQAFSETSEEAYLGRIARQNDMMIGMEINRQNDENMRYYSEHHGAIRTVDRPALYNYLPSQQIHSNFGN